MGFRCVGSQAPGARQSGQVPQTAGSWFPGTGVTFRLAVWVRESSTNVWSEKAEEHERVPE